MTNAKHLTSLLFSTALIFNPLFAQAGGMSRIGSIGQMHAVAPVGLYRNCGPAPQGQVGGFHPTSINNNIQIYKPVDVNNNVNIYKPVNIDNNLNVQTNIDINKPVTINKNIDSSKNINITNNIDNSKYIDASKNIDINKTIIINKGGGHGGSTSNSQADAVATASAIAAAMASASSSSSAVVNFNGSAGAFIGSSSYVMESPTIFGGGDLGSLSVEAASAPVVATAPSQCTFQDTTVVKAIHAVCVAAGGHEFPASHMAPDTWINSSYEGEVARCIPGSYLKVTIGKVMQSSEGMAAGYTSGQALECGLHEAIRHYKDGVLKCAPAVPVPDCTERTNLRKYGTGDMFFTYRAKICLETHDEYSLTSSIAKDRQ